MRLGVPPAEGLDSRLEGRLSRLKGLLVITGVFPYTAFGLGAGAVTVGLDDIIGIGGLY
jgi:hypothetical protein